MTNLVTNSSYRPLVLEHHRFMRERMLETDDHYVLAPGFGMEGLNMWKSENGRQRAAADKPHR